MGLIHTDFLVGNYECKEKGNYGHTITCHTLLLGFCLLLFRMKVHKINTIGPKVDYCKKNVVSLAMIYIDNVKDHVLYAENIFTVFDKCNSEQFSSLGSYSSTAFAPCYHLTISFSHITHAQRVNKWITATIQKHPAS